MSEIQIDNVGISMVFNYKPKITVRTFKPACGAYIRFTIADGRVLRVDIERFRCKQPCDLCNAQTLSARALIKSGK